MTRTLTLTLGMLLALPAFAQDQQAGTAASADTDALFQALIDKCDDTDALMLRSRIRLQLPRTTEEAAATAQKMLDEAFATCGEGDLDGAKAKLNEALKIAEAGATENFGTDASGNAADAAPAKADTTAADTPAEAKKPWWKFW